MQVVAIVAGLVDWLSLQPFRDDSCDAAPKIIFAIQFKCHTGWRSHADDDKWFYFEVRVKSHEKLKSMHYNYTEDAQPL